MMVCVGFKMRAKLPLSLKSEAQHVLGVQLRVSKCTEVAFSWSSSTDSGIRHKDLLLLFYAFESRVACAHAE